MSFLNALTRPVPITLLQAIAGIFLSSGRRPKSLRPVNSSVLRHHIRSPPTCAGTSKRLALVVVVSAIALPLPALLVAIVVSLTIVIVAVLVVVFFALRLTLIVLVAFAI